MHEEPLHEGERFGRYELTRRIGRGGMGEVWLATAHGPGGFQKKVVIKTILPELSGSDIYVDMLINEASLAARLNHPNIVQVFELGCERGFYFIAMEYLPGRTLSQVLSRTMETSSPLPEWLVLEVAALCCDGLGYAHELADDDGEPLGLLHRDISPGNLMLSFTGKVTVLDFGIAVASKVADDASRVLKGKFTYMAPERIRGLPADPRSDIYSLGVVLYIALTWRRPFQADSDRELLARIVEDTPPPPRTHAPHLSPEVEDIVMKAMARRPADRFGSAGELAATLRHTLRRRGHAVSGADVALHIASLFPETTERPSAPGRRRPTTLEPVPAGGAAEPSESEIEIDLSDLEELSERADDAVNPPGRPRTRWAHGSTSQPFAEGDGEEAEVEAPDDGAGEPAPIAPGDLFGERRALVDSPTDVFAGYTSMRPREDDDGERGGDLASLFSRGRGNDPGAAFTARRSRESRSNDPFGGGRAH